MRARPGDRNQHLRRDVQQVYVTLSMVTLAS